MAWVHKFTNYVIFFVGDCLNMIGLLSIINLYEHFKKNQIIQNISAKNNSPETWKSVFFLCMYRNFYNLSFLHPLKIQKFDEDNIFLILLSNDYNNCVCWETIKKYKNKYLVDRMFLRRSTIYVYSIGEAKDYSRVFLLRQLWTVNYYVKSSSNNLSNENIHPGISREIIFKK